MARPTRTSLSDFAAEKPGKAVHVAEPAAEPAAEKKTRGQTLRLAPEAWRQLKLLALDGGTTSHALLIEAVNDLFTKHGKPPVA